MKNLPLRKPAHPKLKMQVRLAADFCASDVHRSVPNARAIADLLRWAHFPLKFSPVKGRRLCTNTPTWLRNLYNQFLVNVPETNIFFQLVVNKGQSHMRIEKRHSALTEAMKGK